VSPVATQKNGPVVELTKLIVERVGIVGRVGSRGGASWQKGGVSWRGRVDSGASGLAFICML